MQNGVERYIETIKCLDDMFEFMNVNFFESSLSKPVITVQRDEKNKAYGWCTRKRVWHEDKTDEGNYEINITAQYLSRPIADIFETLLHEMCHLYAKQYNIQDCSRSGNYHNKKYAEIARAHGLEVSQSSQGGWNVTKLTADSKLLFDSYIAIHPATIIYRDAVVKNGTTKSSSTRKYVCPVCGLSVRATKQVNIICADCDEEMVEEI